MDRWIAAIKGFATGIDGGKTLSVLAICYGATRVIFNGAEAEVMTEGNATMVMMIVSLMGTAVGYLVGRFDPGRKELVRNTEHRIVWLLYGLLVFLLIWFLVVFRFHLGIK